MYQLMLVQLLRSVSISGQSTPIPEALQHALSPVHCAITAARKGKRSEYTLTPKCSVHRVQHSCMHSTRGHAHHNRLECYRLSCSRSEGQSSSGLRIFIYSRSAIESPASHSEASDTYTNPNEQPIQHKCTSTGITKSQSTKTSRMVASTSQQA